MYASIYFETEFFSLLKSNREEKWWALWVLEGLQRFLLLLLLLSTACLRCCCWCCCLRFPFDSTETQCVLCVLCTNKKERNRGKTTFAWGLHRFAGSSTGFAAGFVVDLLLHVVYDLISCLCLCLCFCCFFGCRVFFSEGEEEEEEEETRLKRLVSLILFVFFRNIGGLESDWK